MLITSETVQEMPNKFPVKIVQLKVYNCYKYNMTIAIPMTLTFIQGHKYASQTWLLFNFQYLGQYLNHYIKTWHDGRLIHAIYAQAHFNDLDCLNDARSQCVGKDKKSVLNALGN